MRFGRARAAKRIEGAEGRAQARPQDQREACQHGQLLTGRRSARLRRRPHRAAENLAAGNHHVEFVAAPLRDAQLCGEQARQPLPA